MFRKRGEPEKQAMTSALSGRVTGDRLHTALSSEDPKNADTKRPTIVTIGNDPDFLKGLLSLFELSEDVEIQHVPRIHRPKAKHSPPPVEDCQPKAV